MENEDLYKRFLNLFAGLDRAYGKYILPEDIIATDGEKLKGHGVTVREDLLPEHYFEHLDGKGMLGVVPIQDGNHVVFAAIDIDDYNVDIRAVLAQIKDLKLPLVSTRSKSGGMHLWMFFAVPIAARVVKVKLEEICDALGFPGIEVFPKQNQIGPDDVGNWINLPWFNHKDTDRYGWTEDCEDMRDLAEWLDYAESQKITLKDLNRIKVEDAPAADRPFQDGPPCLQSIAERGIPDGMRNMTMFPIAVYAHAKFEDNVDQVQFLHETNAQYCDPRLDDREVERIRQQVEGNEYRYPCTQAPIKDFCNRELCLRRKYGVRLNGESFSFGTLWHFIPTTHDGTELNHEGHWRLQINRNEDQFMMDLSSEELMVYRVLRRKALELHVVLPNFDNNDWAAIIEDKISTCESVHVAEELSSVGVLRAYISAFLNLHGKGTESKLEVLHGKCWRDEEANEYWFKSEHFLAYLKVQRFTDYQGTRLNNILKEKFGFKMTRRRINEDPTRIWICPSALRVHKDVTDMNVPEVF